VTRQLVLIRHAKASQGGADFERALAKRGEHDSPAIGRWLAEHDLAPDHVVVSPARRTVQTWRLASTGLAATEPVFDMRVYRNTVEDLLEVIRPAPAPARTVILVGHNPSLEELAMTLDDGQGDARARRDLATKFPTSAIAVFDVQTEWAKIDSAAGTLRSFAIPRG
jgi:phosphohistidine phosphatase